MKSILSALALSVWVIPGTALAHSALSGSVPAADSVAAGPVTEVALTFKDPMRLTRVEIEGADGPFELEIPEPSGTEFVLPASLEAGDYELRWIGLGPDGHPMKGSFVFEIE